MNWPLVGVVSFLVYGSIAAYCLSKRRWTVGGLLVGLFNLFLVFLNSVAPIRGWVDEAYVGFSLGYIRVEQGPGVTLVAGALFLGALACACIAFLNKTGKPMIFVALFDGLMALNIGGALVQGLIRNPQAVKIQLGEFLTISPLPATLILLGAFALPLAASALWASRRSPAVAHT